MSYRFNIEGMLRAFPEYKNVLAVAKCWHGELVNVLASVQRDGIELTRLRSYEASSVPEVGSYYIVVGANYRNGQVILDIEPAPVMLNPTLAETLVNQLLPHVMEHVKPYITDWKLDVYDTPYQLNKIFSSDVFPPLRSRITLLDVCYGLVCLGYDQTNFKPLLAALHIDQRARWYKKNIKGPISYMRTIDDSRHNISFHINDKDQIIVSHTIDNILIFHSLNSNHKLNLELDGKHNSCLTYSAEKFTVRLRSDSSVCVRPA